MLKIELEENGIYMLFEVSEERKIRLLHFSSIPFSGKELSESEKQGFRIVEMNFSGLDRPEERHGTKYIVTAPGYRLIYVDHKDYRNEWGRKLEVISCDEETQCYVTSHYQFYDGISVLRSYSEVENKGSEIQTLEYLSSFYYNGIEREGIRSFDDKMLLWIPHNSWQRELQWKSYRFRDLGLEQSQPEARIRSSKAIAVTNTGNWSTKEYLPMGLLQNQETESSLFWQIEHNGSWHWEISDVTAHYYLQLSGPTEQESHWFKQLKPGETFISVPVAVGVAQGDFDLAIGELTKYRRTIRRTNADNQLLGIIFNDYMNCLFADPTTEKELPLIRAAAAAGCEYFCVDAGWYADGFWWDSVGEWQPSKQRFPEGIKEVISYIRDHGMIPGLWLEPEVMGIFCPMVKTVPDDWFFIRHGKKVYDRSRFQLDFRNPEVINYLNAVVERLVMDYGIGYIKMDYNIEPGIGTELYADSVGEGLFLHERAYLKWLDELFLKYPDLIIENCSSGGLRMDYAMLSRCSIQSTSDQEDYICYATIAANAPTGVTPEQAAIWSYPLKVGDREEVVFNMVNALLLRVHQSGHLAELSKERKELVTEALTYYKTIRQDIKTALPFWPLGLSSFSDTWVSLGLRTTEKTYLAVWRRNSSNNEISLLIKHLKGQDVRVKCSYPEYEECSYYWNKISGQLSICMPHEISARIFELEVRVEG